MKICCISDLHRQYKTFNIKIPECDLLIFAGDDDWQHSNNIKDFNKWIGSQPAYNKVVIAGNHDFYAQQPDNKISKYLTEAIYLQSSGCEIGGLKIWGSPYTPIFMDWSFMLPYTELVKEWNKIPEDTNILITHGPPHKILDMLPYGINPFVGDIALRNKVETLPNLKLHVFGHIHCCYGIQFDGNKKYINASICNEEYAPVNQPILVNI